MSRKPLATIKTKNFCENIKNIHGKTNFLLYPSVLTDRQTVDLVIQNVTQHDDSCKPLCLPGSRTYFILANAYFTKFILDINDFRNIAFDQEKIYCRDFMLSIREPSNSKNGHVLNSIKAPSNTRLDSNVLSHINNLDQLSILLTPLIEALKYWEKGLATNKDISSDVLSYHIHEHLLTTFNIFKCYRILTHQNQCAKLASKLKNVNCTESLATCIMNLTIALETADMEWASRMVVTGEKIVEEILHLSNGAPTFETIQFFSLKCDFKIRCGQMKQVAYDLKNLLASEYFKKSTVNRYYLKALVLYTATKFPGDSYEYSDALEEFTEPLFMSFTIIRTWSETICNMDSEQSYKIIKPHEPLWFQYAMYSMLLTSYELFSRFNINNENPLEVEYFHNFTLSICRQNCFLYWIRKILVTGALVDWLTDKPEHAGVKINICMDFFKSKNRTMFLQSSQDHPTSRPVDGEVSGDDETFTIRTRLVSDAPIDECLHDCDVNLYKLKKEALNYQDYEDDTFTSQFDLEKLLKADPEDCDVYAADALRLEGLILLVLIKYSSPRDRISYLSKLPVTNTIKNSLTLVRNVAKTVDRPDSSTLNLVKKELLECTRDLLTVRLRVWINCIHINSFELAGDRTKALSIASSIFNKSFAYRVDCLEGYSSRMQFAELCSLYSRLLLTSPLPITEYEPASVEELVRSCISASLAFDSSPSPPTGRRSARKKLCPPKAPNGKSNKAYKLEELGDYYKKLGQVLLDEKNLPRLPSQYTESPVARYRQILDQLSPTVPQEFEKTVKTTTQKSIATKTSEVNKKVPLKSSVADKDKDLRSALKNLTLEDANKCPNVVTIVSKLASEEKAIFELSQFLLKYLSSHPPASIYRNLKYLAAVHYLSSEKPLVAGHHFSEMAAVAFRYHAIRVTSKRLTKKKKVTFGIPEVAFVGTKGPTSLDQCLSEVPPSWRMVQITIEGNDKPGPGLLITRYQKDKEPVVLRIKSVPQKHHKNFMTDLVEILELSNNSIIDKDPQTFWSVRGALDMRLQQLMQSVELAWLGPWKGLFIGSVCSSEYTSLVDDLVDEMKFCVQELNSNITNLPLLQVLIESIPFLTQSEFHHGLATITSIFNINFSTQWYKKCRDAFEKEFGLSELDQLILDLKTSPVGLILGTGLDLLPWECLPTANSLEQQFFRIPSLRLLSIMVRQWKHLLPSSKSTYYMLNPTNNLHKTQAKFEDKFKQMQGWTGCIGTQPKTNELLIGLENCHIYIFFGHGAGSCYYRKLPSNLEGVDLNTISLVIGCSSGRLRQDGNSLEPNGTPYRFILNGAPSYVGVLWDVTDVDIDSYSDSMLTHWLPGWVEKYRKNTKSTVVTLASATAKARQACRLKYIVGAAPVLYGLPLACENELDKIK